MLKKVDYSTVKPFASAASKDRVSTSDGQKTQWFLWGDDVNTPAFCGLLQTSTGYRIKGVWVHPSKRGVGLGATMTEALIDHAVNNLMACRIEVFAYNPSYYEATGFKRYGSLPNGAIKLDKRF